jgi:tetratricopeptide (TPR) repeat protein
MRRLELIPQLIFMLALCLRADDKPKGWKDWMTEGARQQAEGKYSEAVASFRQALREADEFPRGDRRLLNSIDALASAYADGGLLAESAYQYRRGLAMLDSIGRHNSIDYALLLGSLASMSPNGVDANDTTRILRNAIEAGMGTGQQRSSLQTYLFQVYRDHGRKREAESILVEERDDFKRRKDVTAQERAVLLNCLGGLRFEAKRYREAKDLYSDALEVREAARGLHSPELIEPLNNVGSSLLGMGRLNEAEPIFQRALALCNETLNVRHPSCGITLNNYAACLRRLGRKKEATRLEASAREIRRAADRQNGIGQIVSVGALR